MLTEEIYISDLDLFSNYQNNLYKEIFLGQSMILNQDYYGFLKETHKDKSLKILNQLDYLLQLDKTNVLQLIQSSNLSFKDNYSVNDAYCELPKFRNAWFEFMKKRNYIYDYVCMKNHFLSTYGKELIEWQFHPKNQHKWNSWGV
jgi:hypothetical protein